MLQKYEKLHSGIPQRWGDSHSLLRAFSVFICRVYIFPAPTSNQSTKSTDRRDRRLRCQCMRWWSHERTHANPRPSANRKNAAASNASINNQPRNRTMDWTTWRNCSALCGILAHRLGSTFSVSYHQTSSNIHCIVPQDNSAFEIEQQDRRPPRLFALI